MFSNNLKMIAKIDKDTMTQLITGILHKEYIPNNLYGKLNVEHCDKCKKNNKNKSCKGCSSQKFDLCSKHDIGAELLSNQIEIVSTEKILSKNEILVYLYYHFCNISNMGEIAVVDERDMANTLHCTLATIYNVNKTLRHLGLIDFDRIGKSLISVVVNNYKETFNMNKYIRRVDKNNKKLKVTNGFLTLSKEWFLKLIDNITSTNSLRLVLYKTLQFDSYKIRNLKNKNYKVKIFFRDIKKILSGNLCNREIKELIDKTKNLFDDKIEMDVINNFAIKQEIQATNIISKYQKHCNKKLQKIFGKTSEDLNSLSLQYGLSKILNIINDFKCEGKSLDDIFSNLGDIVIRLKENINYQLASRLKFDIFEKPLNLFLS